MGLDFVEMILVLEERFDIEIPDEEAEHLTTPGKMKEHVLQKLQISASAVCLTQRAFYRIRTALRSSGCQTDRRIGPSSAWRDLAPVKSGRRKWWHHLSVTAGLPLPELARPCWMVALGIYCSMAVAFLVLLLCFTTGQQMAFVLALVWVASLGIMTIMTSPFRVEFPSGYETLGDTAAFAVSMSPSVLKGSTASWSKADVSVMIDQIIAEQLCTRNFHDESDFFRDLDMG